jgi:hypothetical protein|tara:strand:+ start:3721 stop:3936 length:216 start_codon:yes stop_codon:yes gene_type:complete
MDFLKQEEEFEISSLKKMHPMQVKALMEFIGVSLSVAAALEDESAIEAVKDGADDLIQMLGGVGLKLDTMH